MDKIPVNQYPTHFWISRAGGLGGKLDVEVRWIVPLGGARVPGVSGYAVRETSR